MLKRGRVSVLLGLACLRRSRPRTFVVIRIGRVRLSSLTSTTIDTLN